MFAKNVKFFHCSMKFPCTERGEEITSHYTATRKRNSLGKENQGEVIFQA
jgi:hypothetical protein